MKKLYSFKYRITAKYIKKRKDSVSIALANIVYYQIAMRHSKYQMRRETYISACIFDASKSDTQK